MKICVRCRREMRCDKNGVGADFGSGHVYAGDRFKCPECGTMILVTNDAPIHDPNHRTQEEYLLIQQERYEGTIPGPIVREG